MSGSTVSLTHIKRVGFQNWRNREWWSRRQVSIWSSEHKAWWRPEGHGYTDNEAEAWVLDFHTAYERTEHCGPEKGINYFAVPSVRHEEG